MRTTTTAILSLLWLVSLVTSRSLVDTLKKDDRFTELIHHLNRTQLLRDLERFDTGTVFAPVNEAFNKDDDDHLSRAALLYHVLPSAVTTQDFYDGQLLGTSYHRQKLKVTKQKKNQWAVGNNDAKIIDADVKTDNGVIQVIDSVLKPLDDLTQTLLHDNDLQEFGNLIERSKLDRELKRVNGFTVFATQGVLDGLPDDVKDYLDHSAVDLAKVLGHQIHAGPIYSYDLEFGKKEYSTLQGEPIIVEVNKNNEITVNGAKVIRHDILASNGVIHLVEKPILPKHRGFLEMDVRKTLISMNASKFVGMLEDYGLHSYLESKAPQTILAPTNDVLKDDEHDHSRGAIVSWLKYHIINDKYTKDNLSDGQLLQTQSSHHLGDHMHQRLPIHIIDKDTIQFGGSGISDCPRLVDNSIVYPLSRPLAMPRSALGQLPLDLDLSTFVASLYASKASDMVDSAEGITLLAPTNKAFQQLGLVTKHLLQAPKKLADVIGFQTLTDIFYYNDKDQHCGMTLSKEKRCFNTSIIDQPNTLVSNGVIHKVHRLALPCSLEITHRNLLDVAGTNTFYERLVRQDKDVLDKDKSYILIAPTDAAMARAKEFVLEIHLVPIDKEDEKRILDTEDDVTLNTAYEGVSVVFTRDSVRVGQTEAEIVDWGKTTRGGGGGVVVVNQVLPRPSRQGLAWWQVMLIALAVLAGAALLGAVIYFGYRWWKQRREGYITLDQEQ